MGRTFYNHQSIICLQESWMTDPLAEVVSLLRPRAVYSKVISGAGAWAVRYSAFGEPSFCTMLEGECVLAVDGQEPLTLSAGDFVLMPFTPGFTMSGLTPDVPTVPVFVDPKLAPAPVDDIRHGRREGPPDVRMLGGYFAFDSPDASLLASLLPTLLHVRDVGRLSVLVQLVREESLEAKSGRDLVLERLVELLLIEALRSTPGEGAPPGLLRGLADARLSIALRHLHGDPGAAVDGRRAREEGGAVAVGVFRALLARRGTAADGVPAGLAHGGGEGPARSQRLRYCGSCRTRGLRVGQHVQHGVQPACGAIAGALCAAALACAGALERDAKSQLRRAPQLRRLDERFHEHAAIGANDMLRGQVVRTGRDLDIAQPNGSGLRQQ
jgi:hypothetical protein